MDFELSPFTPNQPVSAEFFVGRNAHIQSLRSSVRMARQGRLQVGWISGERGIGKSSLAALIASIAESEEKAIVAHVHLGEVQELTDLARETHTQILRDNPETKSWGNNLWSFLGERIEKVGAFGLEFELTLSKDELSSTVRNFTNTLGAIVKTAGSEREMILIVFDDINGLAANPKFANWLKSMVDSEATSRRENPVCLIFVGFEDRLSHMKENNPSVGRIFNPLIEIRSWTEQESREFFNSTFTKRGCSINAKDINRLAFYSDGLPVMAHELGNSVWKIAKSKTIQSDEVLDGIFDAAEMIGRKFLNKEVIQALQSKNYRSILKKITVPDSPLKGFEFSRKQLRSMETLTRSEKDGLDNFITRMCNLGTLVRPNGERGVYQFATRMHKIYFMLYAIR